ncbi:hypothetical protein RND71_041254 [Anisodus tanguticus]|uniref:Uncharacterized protein n=1 Tax=Anisodus tanguticus TaxID=243964 RepID=A0AAE1QWZ9_9SOLA|nr:hypothetical protein RND71_041254 [Anisodus tanguticus]
MGAMTVIDILLAIILPPLGVFLKFGCKHLEASEENASRKLFCILSEEQNGHSDIHRHSTGHPLASPWCFPQTYTYQQTTKAYGSQVYKCHQDNVLEQIENSPTSRCNEDEMHGCKHPILQRQENTYPNKEKTRKFSNIPELKSGKDRICMEIKRSALLSICQGS